MAISEDTAILSPAISARDHAQGPADAPLTLVEYGDFECPHCGRAHPIVKAVQKHFGKRLRFVFRNFPLGTIHPNAERAAERGAIAGRGGAECPGTDEGAADPVLAAGRIGRGSGQGQRGTAPER